MIILLLCVALTLRADTITTRDSRSWNGRAETAKGGGLTLTASFRSGAQTLTFAADYVRAVEFNSATFNPGAPPASLPAAKTAKLAGTIYFRERNRKEAACGGDITISNDLVRC